ncbi:hypothetical protein CBR_g38094 [Chara braunii]|uniref:Serine incorporator n=1 Tax=Chara braunii TaxID=69332 RepID=A0A388K0D4_CHABU|nr:hypothetical protein CBR_g38094 [Chara braunii]|eukprot:GBG63476.1 hypothetical protein CBR_g38094 [Chara braunii]
MFAALGSCVASCCAVCACEACKGVAGGITRRSARLAYCGIFFFALLTSWVLRDFAEPVLEKIPWIDTMGLKPSKEWYGTQAVLRVTLGNFLFFLLFSILLCGVKDKREVRDGWQHGGWMLKFILWIAIIVIAFLVPNSAVHVYGHLARFGSGVFLLIQVVLLLDFMYTWNESWVSADDERWLYGLFGVSALSYILTGVLAGLLFYWFNPAGEDCQLNIFFISFTLFLTAAISVLSVHPSINGSLLPSSIITLYCMYLCYNALASEPRTYECNGLAKHLNAVSRSTLLMGVTTTMLAVVYSAVRAGSSTSLFSPPDSPTVGGADTEPMLAPNRVAMGDGKDAGGDEEEGTSSVSFRRRRRDDPHPVSYNYSFFHIIFALASMYSAMLLTGWGREATEGTEIIDVGWTSVWVKMGSQWVTVLLYVWSLMAPLIFPDRDFS